MLWITRIASAAAILGALVSLTTPMALQEVDRAGQPIPCGSGVQASHVLASHEDDLNRQLHDSLGSRYQTSDYVDRCDALVSTKRIRASWVGAAGVVVMVTTFLGRLGGARLMEEFSRSWERSAGHGRKRNGQRHRRRFQSSADTQTC